MEIIVRVGGVVRIEVTVIVIIVIRKDKKK